MRKKTTIAATLCAVGALALGACSSSGSSSSTTSTSSGTSSTLVMESSPSGPVSQDFNPFSSTSADNILGATNMIYDPLMQFDLLKPNAAINTNGLPLAGASATNPTTLVVNFTSSVYTLLYYITETPMIP